MATMQQVADRAGVSIATVSFVVNGTKRVAPQTAARVRAAMDDLGFRNNVVARALASRRTRIIALLLPAVEHRMRGSSLDFFTSAAARAADFGYHLVLWPVDPTGNDLDDLLSGGLVDGVILMEVKMQDPRIDKLTQLGVPFTSIGRTRDPDSLAFVDIDFETTVEDSLDYLTSLGHRRFGFIIEDLEGTAMAGYAPHIRVVDTFLASCERRGVVGTVVDCGHSTQGGRQAALDLLAADPDVTGVLIMKDDSVFGLLSGLIAAGRRVPGDISILSLATTTEAGAQHDPAISTMDSPGRELGRLAAEALIRQLDGPDAPLPHVLLPCVLHVAESTGPAPVRATASAPATAPVRASSSKKPRRTPKTAAGTTAP